MTMTRDDLLWRTSRCSGAQGNCVEVASAGRTALVRDSKHRTGARLTLEVTQWTGLIRGIKDGRYDL